MPKQPSTKLHSVDELQAEIVRLNKVIRALVDRAERSTYLHGSDFCLFQTSVMLEEQIRARTEDLASALHENEKITRALRESEEKFRGVLSQSLVGIAIIEGGKFVYTNDRFNEIFGYDAEEIRSLGPIDIAIDGDRSRVAESLRKRIDGEVDRVHYFIRGQRKDGEVIDLEVYGNTITVGDERTLISVVMDVSERTRAERQILAMQERLLDQSLHDSLTNLYNRRYLDEALKRELILAERGAYPVSLIMCDLDHFKKVNDQYGHQAGDDVLRTFADLLRNNARASDICCRYGGEEFLLVLPQMTEKDAVDRAELLRSTMAAVPVYHDSTSILESASFGIATFPRDGDSVDRLIAAADDALYASKAAGRNRVSVASHHVK